MPRIGQPHKGQLVLAPELLELLALFGANSDDLSAALHKALVVMAQLHHMRAAVGSKEAAVENEDNVLAPGIVGQSHGTVSGIQQLEIHSLRQVRSQQNTFGHACPRCK
jgi:hypothetical protein